MKTTIGIALTFALTSLLAACGDEEEPENLDVEGCEHLQEGPFQQLTAGATRDSSAPEIDDDHVSYDVALPARSGGGGNGGFVFFGAAAAADVVFFLDADVDVVVTDPGGDVIAPEETATSSEICDDIAGKYTVELTVGTHFLELTSPDVEEVSIVIEAGGEHAEE